MWNSFKNSCLTYGVRLAVRRTWPPRSLSITPLLAPWIPLERLLVRRIEPERLCIETVGVAPDGLLSPSLAERSDYSTAHLQALLAWCQRGEVTLQRHGGQLESVLAIVVPPELR